MARQLNVLISETDYAALRRDAYELNTSMSALVRLRLGHAQVIPAMKAIPDDDLPPKSGRKM
jgi:hypothetical protein